MESRIALGALAALTLTTFLGVGYSIYQQNRMRDEVHDQSPKPVRLEVTKPIEIKKMQFTRPPDLSTSFTCNGETHTVNSWFQDEAHPTETWEEFVLRHRAAVIAAKAILCPPR